MSAGNAALTALGVVGAAAAGVWGWSQLEKARAIHGANKAASDIRAAGRDPSAINIILDELRRTEGEGGGVGAAGAAQDQYANEGAGIQGEGTLESAREAMRKAGRPSQLGRNLAVVRPKDKVSQWKIGEGCWLPAEGAAQGWRGSPIANVRGLALGYALTLLDDVYPRPAGSGGIVAYNPKLITPRLKRLGFGGWNGPRWYAYAHNRNPLVRFWQAPPDAERLGYEIMITSTAQSQGGLTAYWDPARGGWVPPDEPVALGLVGIETYLRDFEGVRGSTDMKFEFPSLFLPYLASAVAMNSHFVPFPKLRLQRKNAA